MDTKSTKTETIQKLIDQGYSTRMIAREVHCSLSSVQKVRAGKILKLTKLEQSIKKRQDERIEREKTQSKEVDEILEFERILIPIIVKKMNDPNIFDSTVKLIIQYYDMPIYADKSLPSVNTPYSRHWYLEKIKNVTNVTT